MINYKNVQATSVNKKNFDANLDQMISRLNDYSGYAIDELISGVSKLKTMGFKKTDHHMFEIVLKSGDKFKLMSFNLNFDESFEIPMYNVGSMNSNFVNAFIIFNV